MPVPPKRCPCESETTPPIGPIPSFSLPKECSTVSVHLPFAASDKRNSTPQPAPPPRHLYSPPESAVPYRLPALSRTRPEVTNPPPNFATSNLCRIASLHLPDLAGASLEAVPQPCWPAVPPNWVVPYRLPAVSNI